MGDNKPIENLVLQLDENIDDEYNHEDDEQKMDEYIKNLFPRPLEIIDPDANLDEVLAAKSIGEAIQILCPSMPG